MSVFRVVNMPPCKLDLDLYEDNLLDSCWRVGASRPRAGFSSFDRSEIAAVDIVACCKRITALIEENASKIHSCNSVAARNRHQIYHFKDIARLTCGVTDIYSLQVDFLLGDTKHLLDQMKGNNFNLVLTTKNTVIRINRKRKRVITKESKVTIAKHPRLEKSELLNESVQQYYKNMLAECQVWQSESTQQVNLQESIELPRNCNQSSSYHAITITEEFEIHEDPSNIDPSDGFGESDVMDLTFFEELYPSRDKTQDTPKRRTTIDHLTDILPAKMPRLDENRVELNISHADSAIMNTNYPAADIIDPADVTYIVCEPSLPLDIANPPSRRMSLADNTIHTRSIGDGRRMSCADSATMTTSYTHTIKDVRRMSCADSANMTTTYTQSIATAMLTVSNSARNPRKKNLKIDKCIEYSREKLIKDRCLYLERAVAIPPPSKRRKTPEDLLSQLGKCLIFPAYLKSYSINLSKEVMEVQTEVTLRSIFGDEFKEDLVKEIIVQNKERKKKRKEIVNQPIFVPEQLEDPILTPPLPTLVEINNNNNLNHTISCEDNTFDAHSVMMNLLMIWRNNPEIEGIDANKFIQSFPDRFKASLAFNFLLYLVRDHFIKISKKPNTIEMDQIVLGSESNNLIENLIQGEIA